MSQVVLCRICLRANVGARDIPEFLIELHDEICDYDINDNEFLKYCPICEHLLRKFHDFRKRCQQANKVLIKWNRKKNAFLPEKLLKQIPPFPFGVCDNITRRKVYEYVHHEPENELNLAPIYTATIDKDAKNICITEKIEDTETVMEKIDFQEILLENESNFEEFLEDDIKSEEGDKYRSSENYCDIEVLNDELLSDNALESDGNIEDDKLLMERLEFIRDKATLKESILYELDTGHYNDLNDDVKMTKEIFNKIYDKYNIHDIHMLKPDNTIIPDKLKKFLIYLYRKYNPDYETVFDIEYLDTNKKILQEFNRRKDSRSYLEAPFKCELCYKGFTGPNILEYHNKWHKPTPNDVVCDVCPMRFSNRKKYTMHRRKNHTAVFTCRMCPMVIYDIDVMINHYNQHKGVIYQCPICSSVFLNHTTMNNHRRQHPTSHICSTCARTFVSAKGLYFHRKRKHADEAEADPAEAALCTQCDITFDSHAVYLRHKKLTHQPRVQNTFKCMVCRNDFDSMEALRKHKVDHNHQRLPKRTYRYVWSQGTKRRADRTNVRKGRERVNDPVQRPAYKKCTECNVDVPYIYALSLYKHHMKEHPNVPYVVDQDKINYLCEQCGKTFRVYCLYADHLNQHTGAKPYACPKCPTKFATQKQLWIHSERHKPPRHQCKVCGKLFRSGANLYSHSRIHIGDRRFVCEICSKGFLHAASLREHVNGVHNHIRRKRKLRKRENLAAKATVE